MVEGPEGPCRYAVLSNYGSKIVESISTQLNTCLATGDPDALQGVVKATKNDVTGWITKRCDVIVTLNEHDHMIIRGNDLQQVSGE